MALLRTTSLHFFLCLLLPAKISNFERPTLYVWNVGQGQWLTLSYHAQCIHFDMGGEKAPLERVSQLCKYRNNLIFLSHWDWDHLSYFSKFIKSVRTVCRLSKPDGLPKSSYKKRFLNLLECTQNLKFLSYFFPTQNLRLKSNDLSRVLTLKNHILIPGDSTQKMEKVWIQKLKLSKIKILILGHHGSRTSSSQLLLNRLENLKLAIASARKKKYGHPHQVIQKRLTQKRVSLLRTEDWNHIVIDLSQQLRFKF